MKNARFICFILALGLAAACGKTEKTELNSEEIILTAEGPLYDGSNTASADWKANLNALGIAAGDIRTARVKAISITTEDPADLALINDITFQFAGKAVSMQRIGFLNPVPDGVTSLELQVADEQEEIAAFFKLDKMTLVSDVNLKAEKEGNLYLKVKMTIEFDVNAK